MTIVDTLYVILNIQGGYDDYFVDTLYVILNIQAGYDDYFVDTLYVILNIYRLSMMTIVDTLYVILNIQGGHDDYCRHVSLLKFYLARLLRLLVYYRPII
jgi:hypothetical protein